MKILLFDIDGTLLMTGGAGKVAFDQCFLDMFGIPNAWRNIRPDGKTDPIIIDELSRRVLGRELDRNEYSELCEKYRVCFREEIRKSAGYRLLPGVKALLEKLHENTEIRVGVATGNFETTAWLKLERGDIRDYFKFGGFGSDARDRKELTRIAAQRGQALLSPEVTPLEIFVIGDTIHDIDAGRALGAKTIAVSTGRTSYQDLKSHGPDFLLENFSEPDEFLRILK